MTNDEFLSRYIFKELTEDVLAHSRRMVSRSYVFCPKENPQKVACAFSVSYDSLRITDLSNRKQEEFRELNDLSEKRLKRYSGILIGRLAVNQAMAHQGIGTALMNFIKMWLGHGGKAGCRFLNVCSFSFHMSSTKILPNSC